jgi:hypothetical protein
MKRDPFLLLSSKERRLYIEQASIRTGTGAFIIEKDFWVCWILKVLFDLPDLGDHLTFKGGTALSKAYGVIARFSEDIDLSFHRSFLGYGGEKDPENAPSSNKRTKGLESLQAASVTILRDRLFPQLQAAIEKLLSEKWALEFDSADPQTILFHYPTVGITYETPYIAPYIKIEFGARSDNWPKETKTISSYVSEAFPEILGGAGCCEVKTLSVGRTFWEKATILHAEFHRAREKVIPVRYSRHYYDLFCISESDYFDSILSDFTLLDRVTQHKMAFFQSKWANYETAHAGTLKLYPQESRIEALKKDYQDMISMFRGTPPAFDTVLEKIKDVEGKINSRE